MRHAWIANDGTVFESETECREYEREKVGVFMFNGEEEITDPEEADIVLVKNEETYWNCIHNNSDFPGVNGPGWYVWSALEERYWSWDEIKELYDAHRYFIEEQIERGLEPNWD